MEDPEKILQEAIAKARFAKMTLAEAQAAYLKSEEATRERLAVARDREARKTSLLERIANQLHAIQQLIMDTPSPL